MFKKLIAVFCSIFCMLAGFMPVFAAEDCQITVQDPVPGQVYTAYQIFAGDPYQEDGEVVLDNLDWGSSIDKAKLNGQILPGFDKAVSEDNAREIAQELSGKSDTQMQTAAESLLEVVNPDAAAGSSNTQTGEAYIISGLEPGYYLITDQISAGSSAKVQSAILLEVVSGTVTVTPKKGAPTQTKQVKTQASADYSSPVEWSSETDASAGDVIDYRLIHSLPAQMSYYQSYKMQISDTMDQGLSLDPSSISLKVEAGGKRETVSSDLFSVSTSENGFTINIPDAKQLEVNGQPAFEQSEPEIIVTYSCTLNDKAMVYSQKNQNTATLTYSNSPEDSSSENTTPKSVTSVYTFGVSINKTDSSGEPLSGAEFTLYKEGSDGKLSKIETVSAKQALGEGKNIYEFNHLSSGTYVLKETVTPAGYSTADPVTFTVRAHYTVDQAGNAALNNVTVDGVTTTLDDQGIFHINIQNQKGLHLPKTGSAGMAVLLIVGVTAICLGLLFRKKNNPVR